MKKLEELEISPAPWKVKYDEIPAEYGGGRFFSGIVSRFELVRIDTEMRTADANIIAAAPNMYQKAYELIDAFDRREMKPEHINALRAALAKAAGEEAK